MKILVIEDQPDIRETLRDILEINGHEVLMAEDGVRGVELAAESPGFIFCDVEMPNLDGHGVRRVTRQMPSVRDVPFVFLTAKAERDDFRAGMTLGADDYITKPFSERDILDAIASRVERQQPLRAQVASLLDYRQSETQAGWSHELMTPLNAVLGPLQILEMEADTISRAELKEMLALIRAGAESQERLAQKLVRFFDLEQLLLAGAPPPSSRGRPEVAVDAGARRAAREAQREGDLHLSVAPGMVAVADGYLVQAVYEIATNAFYFSPKNTPVGVRGWLSDGNYHIELSDEGPGMSPEQCAGYGAFRKFDRTKREQPGLGLGLAIARATAKLAGGSLLLEPGPQGRGLRVVFSLPAV